MRAIYFNAFQFPGTAASAMAAAFAFVGERAEGGAGQSEPAQQVERGEQMIMPLRFILGIAACLAFPAFAQEDLARRHNCLACHSVDTKLVGPSFKDVSNKYRGDDTAVAKLAEKVKKGGSGTWGPIGMPPNGSVPDDDIKKLVSWVLSQ